VEGGPCPEISAFTAAKLLESEAAWSTLLITPTVLVPVTYERNLMVSLHLNGSAEGRITLQTVMKLKHSKTKAVRYVKSIIQLLHS